MNYHRTLVALGLMLLPVAAFASGGADLGDLISTAPGSMLWTILTFLILLIVLWKFAWGPIVKGLEERENKIQGAIDDAKRDREEAAKLLAQYEDKLKEASAEISERLKKAEQEAQVRIEKATEEAREEGELIRKKTLAELEAEKAKLASELRKELVDIAAQIATAAIGESFSRDDQIRIIQKRLEQLESQS